MLDPRLLRNDLPTVVERQRVRGFELDASALGTLEGRRKALQTDSEALRARHKGLSKAFGQAKATGDDAAVSSAGREIAEIAERQPIVDAELASVQKEIGEIALAMPNLVDESVPPGRDESDNVELRRVGAPREFNYAPRDHVDLGARDSGAGPALDFESAALLTGSRFAVMRADIARLHRALVQLMLDTHVEEHGYTELNVPYIVNRDSLVGTGQLPKFEEDLFALRWGDPAVAEEAGAADADYFLVPTSEVPLTNLVRGRILEASELPLRMTCHSPCFRSEAGSYGRDTRGLIRQHQFEKVEMVQVTRPADSFDALEAMTGHAEAILAKLELPYRVVVLCGGDIGFAAARTHDIEVWLPSQDTYREISSVSNCTDFQARRMQARWREPGGKPELVHTLNGSGLAVGRALVAVLENHQQADGSVAVPDALQPYLGGRRTLLAP